MGVQVMRALGSMTLYTADAMVVSPGGAGWERDGVAAFCVIAWAELPTGETLTVESGGMSDSGYETFGGDAVVGTAQGSSNSIVVVQSWPVPYVSVDPYEFGWHITCSVTVSEINVTLYLVAGAAREMP